MMIADLKVRTTTVVVRALGPAVYADLKVRTKT